MEGFDGVKKGEKIHTKFHHCISSSLQTSVSVSRMQNTVDRGVVGPKDPLPFVGFSVSDSRSWRSQPIRCLQDQLHFDYECSMRSF